MDSEQLVPRASGTWYYFLASYETVMSELESRIEMIESTQRSP
jgi:hypothetical protein